MTVRVSRFHRRFPDLDSHPIRWLSAPAHPVPTALAGAFMILAAALNDGLQALEPGCAIQLGFCNGGVVWLMGAGRARAVVRHSPAYDLMGDTQDGEIREILRSYGEELAGMIQEECIVDRLQGEWWPPDRGDWERGATVWVDDDRVALRVGYRSLEHPPILLAEVRWTAMFGSRAQLAIRSGRLNLPVCDHRDFCGMEDEW